MTTSNILQETLSGSQGRSRYGAKFRTWIAAFSLACPFLGTPTSALAQQIRPPNYDESLVPKLNLPSVLQSPVPTEVAAIQPSATKIATPQTWDMHRLALVSVLAEQEYGQLPTDQVEVESECYDDAEAVLGGKPQPNIRRRQIAITLMRGGKSVRIDMIVWSPKGIDRAPCFVGLNFRGNQSTCDDPNVRLTSSWCDARNPGVENNRATEASRANQSDRWPIAEIISQGFAVATAHYGDIDPDFDDGFENGVHALFPEFKCTAETPNRWGSIGGWAWGLSRMADVLQKTDGIRSDALFVVGHSRLGKTALWAGANDQRFRIVISNNSGCGGAALSQRAYGESVARINTSFPHWFNRNFRRFNDREESMPFDQHQLIAAIAPRPVYIASATKDRWADPLGELLSGFYASPAYELHSKPGFTAQELPQPNTPIGSSSIGYHIREGEHDLLLYDWQQFMAFAKKNGF